MSQCSASSSGYLESGRQQSAVHSQTGGSLCVVDCVLQPPALQPLPMPRALVVLDYYSAAFSLVQTCEVYAIAV